MQGRVVIALPWMLLLGLHLVEPVAVRTLFHSVAGWVTLGIVLTLQVAGYVSIRRLVQPVGGSVA